MATITTAEERRERELLIAKVGFECATLTAADLRAVLAAVRATVAVRGAREARAQLDTIDAEQGDAA